MNELITLHDVPHSHDAICRLGSHCATAQHLYAFVLFSSQLNE